MVHADVGAVQGQVIVLGHAPVPARVVLIVHPALFVLILKPLLRAALRLAVQADDAVCPVGHGGMDKDVEHVLPLPQDIVGAAADNDASALLCQLQDDLPLHTPQKVRGGHAVHHSGHSLSRQGIGQQALAHGELPPLLDEPGVKAGLFRHGLDQLLIVIFPAQALGQGLAHAASAAAKLTADGDDPFFHKSSSFVQPVPRPKGSTGGRPLFPR